MNSRFLPMGVAFAPSLPGSPLKRAAQGQTVVDVSLVIAEDGKGGFDRNLLFGSTAAQYVGWVTGTIVGVLAGPVLGPVLKTIAWIVALTVVFAALAIRQFRRLA